MNVRGKIERAAAASVFLLWAGAVASPAQLEPIGVLEIAGEVPAGYDVSAVEIPPSPADETEASETVLVFGVDEGCKLLTLQSRETGCGDDIEGGEPYRACVRINLRETDAEEAGEVADGDCLKDGEVVEFDVEGLARSGDTYYAVGSHSAKRKKVKGDKKHGKNRDRLAETGPEPDRSALFRFRLDPGTGRLKEGSRIDRRDLDAALAADPYLKSFVGIPSKENGVDVEGLAADGERLFVGFRGPVLRGGWVPVMVLDSFDAAEHELRFVQLDGRGIRSLARVTGGFLVLAGPVGDGDFSYRLVFWDGEDCLPGKDREKPPCRTRVLGEVPVWADSKAEGLAVRRDSGDAYEVLVVYDSAPQGLPTLFRVPKPAS